MKEIKKIKAELNKIEKKMRKINETKISSLKRLTNL